VLRRQSRAHAIRGLPHLRELGYASDQTFATPSGAKLQPTGERILSIRLRPQTLTLDALFPRSLLMIHCTTMYRARLDAWYYWVSAIRRPNPHERPPRSVPIIDPFPNNLPCHAEALPRFRDRGSAKADRHPARYRPSPSAYIRVHLWLALRALRARSLS
jgi:hypothetical protein